MTIYKSTKIMPYVYMGIHKETGQFYIGSRASKNMSFIPEHDILKYRTSSKYVKPIFDEFDWYIIAMFFDGKDAWKFEQELIFENWNNPLLLNRSCHINNKHIFSTIGIILNESSKSNSKYWGIIFPVTNNIKYIKNLKKFCREYNLNSSLLIRTADNKQIDHRGFRCFRLLDINGTPEDEYLVSSMLKTTIPEPHSYKIISPNNEHYIVTNLINFCKTYGLSYSGMHMVLSGSILHYKQWKVFKIDKTGQYIDNNLANEILSYNPSIIYYKVINPDGIEFITNNLKEFCINHKLQPTCMCKVASGVRSHHKGWKCFYIEKPPIPDTEFGGFNTGKEYFGMMKY